MTVMNEVNNFASVNFGPCGKSKHFALDLGISLGAAPLVIFLGSKAKCLDFPQCPQITDAQLLTSNFFMFLKYFYTYITLQILLT